MNSVVWHPHQPMIITAGVEKVIRIFSPFPFADDPGKKSSTTERARASTSAMSAAYSMMMSRGSDNDHSVDESLETLVFFDILVTT